MLFAAAIAAACLYLIGLFWLAALRDAPAAPGNRARAWLRRNAGVVYGLSLAVYCTSWTFYGGVGTAANGGLDYLPIYLGPILVFTVGFGLVRRVLAQSKAQHSTSIADFLSARYGKSASVAALVTIIASIGSLPYMALQLQSVGTSMMTLSPQLADTIAANELVLMVAGIMALFAILFGSRRADQAGENAGLVLTIAIEAVVKLVALLAVAALAIVLLVGSDTAPEANPGVTVFSVFDRSQIDARFMVLTVIAASAALCLPRQFHMTFVEASEECASGGMQWVFPAYLLVTAIVIIPIVIAGLTLLPAGTDPDSIVIALPLASGIDALAVLVFIGGFSASAGMIVVTSVALSIMITNDLIAPLAFRRTLKGGADNFAAHERAQLADQLLTARRIVIGALLLFAYMVYLSLGGIGSLAGLGTLAFAAAAQFAPGLVLGILSERGNKCGMISGLVIGALAWIMLLVIPAATGTSAIFMIHEDELVSGVIISLAANCAAYWIGSAAWRPSLVDQAQAAAFIGTATPGPRPGMMTAKRVADVRLLLAQFVGEERAAIAIQALPGERKDADRADGSLVEMAERMISGTIGTSSARMLVASWTGGKAVPLAGVVAMFDETSRRLNFSGELLQIAIENIDTGVALVDAQMALVAWNTRYQEMFDLPEDLVQVGRPIADLIRYNQRNSGLGDEAVEDYAERRLDHMRKGHRHRQESEQADGRVMRIVGSPTPGGGYVTSYTDITADKRAEQALEDEVAARTRELARANDALAEATQSKTRFLAAASHDLIQPLNAARLFASALGEEVAGSEALEALVRDLDGSIGSADRLIRALLDISKLDSGGIVPRIEEFSLDQVFDEVAGEFSVQAAAKGITLKRVRTSVWVSTDRTLLTSVLRNLVSNAIRYTTAGGVLLGARRIGDQVKLCVLDTGRGIEAGDIDRIFREFERGSSTDREGLGLGLAIVRRASDLLDFEIEAHSNPGRGSQFALALPITRLALPTAIETKRKPQRNMGSQRVLVVDNDPSVVTATCALLAKWGLDAISAESLASALIACPRAPGLVIMDYRLNGAERGDSVYSELCMAWKAQPPAILLTAEASEETEFAAVAMDAHRLLKPSSPASLRALISTCLARGKSDVRIGADQALTESAAG